jgi:hypothetical protein
VNRDPIGERGGFNLFAASFNNHVMLVDYLGLNPLAKVFGKCAIKSVGKAALSKLTKLVSISSILKNYIGQDCPFRENKYADARVELPDSWHVWLKDSSIIGEFSKCVFDEIVDKLLGELYSEFAKGKKMPSWMDPSGDIGKNLKEAAMSGIGEFKKTFSDWIMGSTVSKSLYALYRNSKDDCELIFEIRFRSSVIVPGLLGESLFAKDEILIGPNKARHKDLKYGLANACGICPCPSESSKEGE